MLYILLNYLHLNGFEFWRHFSVLTHGGTEAVQVTPLRRTLASSP